MAKKIDGYIKLQIPAGQANPAPPVGPALGAKGVNIMDFCKAYNAATQDKAGMVIPVVITVYQDKSFTFELEESSCGRFAEKSSRFGQRVWCVLNRDKVGKVTRKQLEEIVEIKKSDLNARDMDQAVKLIAGTARSMGIEVEDA